MNTEKETKLGRVRVLQIVYKTTLMLGIVLSEPKVDTLPKALAELG